MWTVTRQIYESGLRIVEIVNGGLAEAGVNMLPKNYVGEGGSFDTFEQANEVAANILRAWQKDTSEQPGYVPQLRVVKLTNLLQTEKTSEEGGEKAHEEEQEEAGGETVEEVGGETVEEVGGETVEEEVIVEEVEEITEPTPPKETKKAVRRRKNK